VVFFAGAAETQQTNSNILIKTNKLFL